jgi:hypothetical protein
MSLPAISYAVFFSRFGVVIYDRYNYGSFPLYWWFPI